jgi:hypothetical protein
MDLAKQCGLCSGTRSSDLMITLKNGRGKTGRC